MSESANHVVHQMVSDVELEFLVDGSCGSKRV